MKRTKRLLAAVRSFRVLATAIAIRTAEVRNADFSSKFGGLKPSFSVLIQSTARNMLDALRAYALSKAWMKSGFNGRRRAVFPVASKRAAAMAGAASAFAASDPPP
jgi:hypothetical protein